MSSEQTSTNDNQFHVPTKLAIALIAGAQLMVVLDATIVNVALPSIQHALKFSPTGLSWVLNGYTLTFGGLLLLGGRSGDVLGRRRMFQIGILIFAIASFFGGFATDQTWIISMRAIQGVGAAIASPTALALITTNFAEGKERTEAFGIYSGVSGGGAAIGLLLGGLLTQYVSWRWVFFVNAPIALLIAIAAPKVLRESTRQSVPLDISGSVLSVSGLGLLVYGLIHASIAGWASTITIASFVGAAISIALFILRESKAKEPLMHLDIFSDRTRSAAYSVMLFLAAALFSMFFFLTLFLQEVHGYSPLKSGLAFLPVSLGIIGFAGLGSGLIRKFGALPLILYGLTSVAVGLFWLSRLSVNSSYVTHILGPILILSSGLGFAFIAIFPTALARVPASMAGLGSAMVNVSQQVGGTLGLSVLVTVSASATSSYMKSLIATDGHIHSKQYLAALGARAAIHGWDIAFMVGAGFAIAGIIIAATLIRPPRGLEPDTEIAVAPV